MQECVCGHKTEEFAELKIPGTDKIHKNYVCQNCGANIRHMQYIRFISQILEKMDLSEKKIILHFAPEPFAKQALGKYNIEHIRADINPKARDVNMIVDITDIKLPDESVDMVIANHVLEHVEDDITAMQEIFRVLKKGGSAMLVTPVNIFSKNTLQLPEYNTDELRAKHYWWHTHVRLYGSDLFEKLKNVGFTIETIELEKISTETINLYKKPNTPGS